LEVRRSDNAVYTEVLEDLSQQTKQIAKELEVARLEREVDRLDREWISSQDEFKVDYGDGRRGIPSGAGAVIGAAIAVIFGLVWVNAAPTGEMKLFGVMFIVAAAAAGLWGYMKAQDYETAQTDFQYRRKSLNRQIDERRRRP